MSHAEAIEIAALNKVLIDRCAGRASGLILQEEAAVQGLVRQGQDFRNY